MLTEKSDLCASPDCLFVGGCDDTLVFLQDHLKQDTHETLSKVQNKLFSCLKKGFGPFQPKNDSFSVDKNGRRFQLSWYGQFNWLEYSTQLAFCFYCRAFGLIGQYDDAFVKVGFKN